MGQKPSQISEPGWRDILLRVKEEQNKHNISIIAAGVAFYSLLAIIPALAAMVSIYGLVFDPAGIQQQLSILLIFSTLGLPDAIQTALSISKWPVLAILIMVAVSILYRYAPDRDRPRFRWITWGAVGATLLWITASLLFSFYVSNFGSYNKTDGSMGTIIILLMWFFLTAYAVLMGAELNAEIEHQTQKDTTRGKPEPIGQRGAHAADTVGRTPE